MLTKHWYVVNISRWVTRTWRLPTDESRATWLVSLALGRRSFYSEAEDSLASLVQTGSVALQTFYYHRLQIWTKIFTNDLGWPYLGVSMATKPELKSNSFLWLRLTSRRKMISVVRICLSINPSLISSLLWKSDVKLQETNKRVEMKYDARMGV